MSVAIVGENLVLRTDVIVVPSLSQHARLMVDPVELLVDIATQLWMNSISFCYWLAKTFNSCWKEASPIYLFSLHVIPWIAKRLSEVALLVSQVKWTPQALKRYILASLHTRIDRPADRCGDCIEEDSWKKSRLVLIFSTKRMASHWSPWTRNVGKFQSPLTRLPSTNDVRGIGLIAVGGVVTDEHIEGAVLAEDRVLVMLLQFSQLLLTFSALLLPRLVVTIFQFAHRHRRSSIVQIFVVT